MHEADSSEESARQAAIVAINRRREFWTHVMVYAVINAFLWALWAFTGAGYPWPVWVSGAWGTGLVLHGWDVYLRRPITEEDIRREIERQRRAAA